MMGLEPALKQENKEPWQSAEKLGAVMTGGKLAESVAPLNLPIIL